jgi:recombination protein RecR
VKSSFSPLVDRLIETLRYLPGVGPKSAQRMAFALLRNHQRAAQLAHSLQTAIEQVKQCELCRTFSETPLCRFCNDLHRDHTTICIVETPADVMAIEQTSSYRGLYFILMGHLSPLDGIGPEDIGIPALASRLSNKDLKEVILATNPTIEGEATAHYIFEIAKNYPVKISRIAHGVPLGGELEFINSSTLAHALSGRAFINLTNAELTQNE